MPKTIVTHINPDLDAITACWLLVRFGGNEFADATFGFVPAGERLEDEDNNSVHVDTGLGKFDHHQPDRGREDTCAATLVYEWLVHKRRIQDQEALRRMVDVVNDLDHMRNFFWDDPGNDRYEFFLGSLLNGLKLGGHVKNDHELVDFGMRCLEGLYTAFKIKVAAEEDLKKGIVFETTWGKTLALESKNDETIKLGIKSGYRVVARRDPESGMVRIKGAPLEEINLKSVYEKIREADPDATWYFHPGGHMVLNGSIRNPKMRPSKLSLDEVITLLKSA